MPILDQTRELEICALYSGGETLQQIGDRYGISRERIRQITRRNELRHLGVGSADPLKVMRLVAECNSPAEIARRLGCGVNSVRAVLNALAPVAGHEMMAYRHEKTREHLLQRLRDLAVTLGRTPIKADLDIHGPAQNSLTRVFGSMSKANRLAGLPVTYRSHPHLTRAARVEIALRYDPAPQGWHKRGQKVGNVAQLAAEYGITTDRVRQIGKQYQARAAVA